MSDFRMDLRVVLYEDGNSWIAHCLEFDLAGDGSTKAEALDSLIRAIAIQVEDSIRHKNPANLFSPAEGRYLLMFAAGKDVATGELELEFNSPKLKIGALEARTCSDNDLVGV